MSPTHNVKMAEQHGVNTGKSKGRICQGTHEVEMPPKGRVVEHVQVGRSELKERDSWPDIVSVTRRNGYVIDD